MAASRSSTFSASCTRAMVASRRLIIVDRSAHTSIDVNGWRRRMAKTIATITEPEICCPRLGAAPMDETDATQLARAFAALGDPARLRILSLLASAADGE